jgi:hypothetical protein
MKIENNNMLAKIAIGISVIALAVSVYAICGCGHRGPRHPGFGGGHHPEFAGGQHRGSEFKGEHGARPEARGGQPGEFRGEQGRGHEKNGKHGLGGEHGKRGQRPDAAKPESK